MPKTAPVTVGDHTLEIVPIVDFGYLTLETDGKTITATFQIADTKGVMERDSVSVDIKSGKIEKLAAPLDGATTAVASKNKRTRAKK